MLVTALVHPCSRWLWRVTRRLCVMQINWAMHDKQELIDIVEVVYRGARKGHGLVVSPKGVRRCSTHSLQNTCLAF